MRRSGASNRTDGSLSNKPSKTDDRASSPPAASALSPVVMYHGLGHRHLSPLGSTDAAAAEWRYVGRARPSGEVVDGSSSTSRCSAASRSRWLGAASSRSSSTRPVRSSRCGLATGGPRGSRSCRRCRLKNGSRTPGFGVLLSTGRVVARGSESGGLCCWRGGASPRGWPPGAKSATGFEWHQCRRARAA
jgi:hypothetical protein